jgi:anti-sigma regulatory factor (Ser/Thr protein kinase)
VNRGDVNQPEFGHSGEARRDFTAEAASVALAREWVSQVAGTHGRGAADDTLRLLVTELASNAVRHADSLGFTVFVDTNARLIVAVCDPSSVMPVVRHPGSAEASGRGLGIVDSMSDSWGASLHSGGKCVWFRLEPPDDIVSDG